MTSHVNRCIIAKEPDIVQRLTEAEDGWSGDAACVSAEVAEEGALEIERLRDLLQRAADYMATEIGEGGPNGIVARCRIAAKPH